MANNETDGPEISLLKSIANEELKNENDEELKKSIIRKTTLLYQLSSLAGARGLDEDEIKRKITSLIEEG